MVLTGIVVLCAVVLVYLKFHDYMTNPWTRDGQVRAEIIQIAPRVSGPIVTLPIKDNQFVQKGDLLFEIDPRTFEANLEQARAQFDKVTDNYQGGTKQVEEAKAQVNVAEASVVQAESAIRQLDSQIIKNKAEYDRQLSLLPQKATSKKMVEWAKANYDTTLEKHKGAKAGLAQAQASLVQALAAVGQAQAALGQEGSANASIRAAKAAVRQAELNLNFTKVTAPLSGYVTNLNLRLGGNVVANQPTLALLDHNSYWVNGFFRETFISRISPGDQAVVTLMSYPKQPLQGRVDSLGWGISQQDGSTGYELLPTVNPTFQWIRLAQRIPVRIHLDEIPEGVDLRVGTTASVLVRTGSSDNVAKGGQ